MKRISLLCEIKWPFCGIPCYMEWPISCNETKQNYTKRQKSTSLRKKRTMLKLLYPVLIYPSHSAPLILPLRLCPSLLLPFRLSLLSFSPSNSTPSLLPHRLRPLFIYPSDSAPSQSPPLTPPPSSSPPQAP